MRCSANSSVKEKGTVSPNFIPMMELGDTVLSLLYFMQISVFACPAVSAIPLEQGCLYNAFRVFDEQDYKPDDQAERDNG